MARPVALKTQGSSSFSLRLDRPARAGTVIGTLGRVGDRSGSWGCCGNGRLAHRSPPQVDHVVRPSAYLHNHFFIGVSVGQVRSTCGTLKSVEGCCCACILTPAVSKEPERRDTVTAGVNNDNRPRSMLGPSCDEVNISIRVGA